MEVRWRGYGLSRPCLRASPPVPARWYGDAERKSRPVPPVILLVPTKNDNRHDLINHIAWAQTHIANAK